MGDCLAWALEHPDNALDMVAGGYTHEERLAIRKGQLFLELTG